MSQDFSSGTAPCVFILCLYDIIQDENLPGLPPPFLDMRVQQAIKYGRKEWLDLHKTSSTNMDFSHVPSRANHGFRKVSIAASLSTYIYRSKTYNYIPISPHVKKTSTMAMQTEK